MNKDKKTQEELHQQFVINIVKDFVSHDISTTDALYIFKLINSDKIRNLKVVYDELLK